MEECDTATIDRRYWQNLLFSADLIHVLRSPTTQVIPLRNTKHQCVQFKEDVHFKRPLDPLDTTKLQNER